MKSCQSFPISIFVGRREGYQGPVQVLHYAHQICQKYCNEVGLCVTVTETTFIYKDGCEPGFIVGLINYPRFAANHQDIEGHAMKLALMLKSFYQQHRVSIQTPVNTYMLEDEDERTISQGDKPV